MLLLMSAGPLFLTISSVVPHIKVQIDDESKCPDGMERSNKIRTCGNPSTERGSHDVTGPDCEDDGAKPPNLAQQKKPKVVMSERRRMQNRQAQKLYRQKQKQRVQQLESLLRLQTTFRQDPDVCDTSFAEGIEALAGLSNTAVAPNMVLPELVQNQDADFRVTNGFNQCMNGTAGIINYYDGGEPGEQSILPYLPSASETSQVVSQVATHLSNDSNSTTTILAAIDPGGKLPVQTFRQTLTLSQELVQKICEKGAAINDVLRLGLRSLEEISRNPGEADGETPSESPTRHRRQLELPDIHANTIRITQMSFISAMMNNASLLGLTVAEISSDDTDSPFYLARLLQNPTTSDGAQGQAADVKQDLRPTRNQLTCSHHPFIDMLPFPTFRERIIASLQANPPILDQKELCHDLQNDGLICWGSSLGAGVGNSGAPWDVRSWEARPWFMKKWWMLTGGVDAEMYQQTRWWCEMRGDHSSSPW